MNPSDAATAQRFNCSACGAPQTYDGTGRTVRCIYCGQTVIVPVTLRHSEQERADSNSHVPTYKIVVQNYEDGDEAWGAQRQGSWGGFVSVILALFVLVTLGFFLREPLTQWLTGAITTASLRNVLPQAAKTELKFGGTGTGEGLFQEAKAIAVDGQGLIYVVDKTKRVQVFDADGNYLRQWRIEGKDAYDAEFDARGLLADRDGNVYVMSTLSVQRYDAEGHLTQTIVLPGLGEMFSSITLTSEGKLLALTNLFAYEGLMWFDAQGNVTRRIEKPISSQFEGMSGGLWDKVAVDGVGNLFILRDNTTDGAYVYLFTPEGKYLSRFGGKGKGQGQLNFPRDLAMDAQSRIYVVDQRGIQRFEAGGRFLDEYPATLAGNYVTDLAVDKTGAMYVIGAENWIYKLVPNVGD